MFCAVWLKKEPVEIDWDCEGMGTGTFRLYYDGEYGDDLILDDADLGKENVKAALGIMIDNAILERERTSK